MAFEYSVNPDFDFTFDEKGNTFLALRKLSWGEGKPEKIELRKWYNSADGTETPNKGFTFLTEEGPHELTKVLVEQGFGYTDDILNGLKDREDFKSSLSKVLSGQELNELGIEQVDPNEDYYDPVSLFE